MVSFNAILPISILVSILVILLAIFIALEVRRKQSFLVLRIAAVCLMMLSLAGLLLRPAYRVEKSSFAILLTDGYDKNKVDSILKVHHHPTLFHTGNAKPYKGSASLPYSALPNVEDEIQFVVGEGLPAHALDLLHHQTFQYVPSQTPTGIVQLSFDEIILPNRRNQLHGVYHNTSSQTKIVLQGPAGKEDSVSINSTGDQFFHLSFQPRQTGNVLCKVIVQKKDGDSLTEILPLHIEVPKPLKILFLQSYPTFETQYLKTFLSAKGHQLLLRYQLSKNNFRYEYANLPSQTFNHLTHEWLNDFDLVIVNTEELKTLSTSEQTILDESIQSGLGLLLVNVDPSKETKKIVNFFPFQFQKTKTDTTTIILPGSSQFTLSASPYRITESPTLKSIIQNKSGILSGYRHHGAGKIALQLLQQTYQLALTGDSSSYANLWSPVIEQVSRLNTSSSKIKIKNSFPLYQDEPIDIEIISSEENPVLLTDSIQSPLQEDVLIDNVWHARGWGSAPGWHTLQVKDDAPLWYYVFSTDNWKPLSIAQQMKANKHISSISVETPIEKITQAKEINPIVFYLLFVMTAGYLWLAPKL